MSLKGILKGFAVAVVMMFLVLIILSAITYFTAAAQKFLNAGMYIGAALSVFTGALTCAKTSGSRLLINCLCMALLYLLLLIVCSVLKNGGVTLNAHFFTVCAGTLLCSVLGAIVGR